jgi:hypothetical protein
MSSGNAKEKTKKGGGFTDENAKWLKPTPKKRKLQEEAAVVESSDEEGSEDDSGPGSLGG